MQAERSPVVWIAIAAFVLVAECVGLLAYQLHEQQVQQDRITQQQRARAVQDAMEAQAQIDALNAERDRLDAELRRYFPTQPLRDRAEVERLRQQLRVRRASPPAGDGLCPTARGREVEKRMIWVRDGDGKAWPVYLVTSRG